jgi:hypothetical protein
MLLNSGSASWLCLPAQAEIAVLGLAWSNSDQMTMIKINEAGNGVH